MTSGKPKIPPEQWYASLPRKRSSAAVIFRNGHGELLIVKPNYRDFWLVPGGVVEKDESPLDAAVRETREEIGLEISAPRFVCVEYLSHHDEKTETLAFLFDGGTLEDEAIARIVLQAGELDEFRFMPPDEAYKILNSYLARRIEVGLEAMARGTVAYMEDGERLS